MPPVRFSAFTYYILLAIFILLNSKIISPCSRYIKKGLVYIAIIALFSWQPSSYFKSTKANTCFFNNMRLVLVNKYIFLIFWYYKYLSSLSQLLNRNTW